MSQNIRHPSHWQPAREQPALLPRRHPRSTRAIGIARDYAGIIGDDRRGGGPHAGRTEDRGSGQPGQRSSTSPRHWSIMSMGMAIVMSMRGVDLTIAQVADAAGLMAAWLLLHEQSIAVVLLVPIAFGLLIGAVNGMLMGYLGVPAHHRDAGHDVHHPNASSSSSRTPGSRRSCSRSQRVRRTHSSSSGRGKSDPFPVEVIIAAAAVVVAYLVTRRSTLGRFFDAVGGNVSRCLPRWRATSDASSRRAS